MCATEDSSQPAPRESSCVSRSETQQTTPEEWPPSPLTPRIVGADRTGGKAGGGGASDIAAEGVTGVVLAHSSSSSTVSYRTDRSHGFFRLSDSTRVGRSRPDSGQTTGPLDQNRGFGAPKVD